MWYHCVVSSSWISTTGNKLGDEQILIKTVLQFRLWESIMFCFTQNTWHNQIKVWRAYSWHWPCHSSYGRQLATWSLNSHSHSVLNPYFSHFEINVMAAKWTFSNKDAYFTHKYGFLLSWPHIMFQVCLRFVFIKHRIKILVTLLCHVITVSLVYYWLML